MSPLLQGLILILVLVALMGAEVPVAFALAGVAMFGLLVFQGPESLSVLAEILFSTLDEFALMSIPLFILMGASIAGSRAGEDLYHALDRWMHRVPGGLLLSNLGACSIFAALTGSSPATCAAVGKLGIPEMQRRGYPAGLAAGAIAAGGTLGILIPPSITMIVYGIATETSIGRLFLAGLIPGALLTVLFMAWSLFYAQRTGLIFRKEGGYTWRERFGVLPKVIPFLVVVVLVLWSLYGGLATPSEAAGVGALACVTLAMVVYGAWRPQPLWEILSSSVRESVMILMIIAGAGLFSYTMSSLYVTQSVAEWTAAQTFNPWLLLLIVNVFLLVAGLFLPPVAVILMTAPTLLPIIETAGFDSVWFAVVLTINMEIGLITPPVGLNLYVIHSIAQEIELTTILRGALPFVVCMVLAIVLLCAFPGIATWLPDRLMGPRG